MKALSKFVSLSLLGLSIITFIGCAKVKEELATPSAGISFSAADIVKNWSSSCISKTDAVLGTTQTKIGLNLNANGTFSFDQYTYAAPSGGTSCAGADYKTYMSLSGTYTVGATITGGQALNFVTTSNSSLMVLGTAFTATQNIFNTDCGGTSPYCTLGGGVCTNNGTGSGVAKNSSSMLCQNYTFPANGTTLYNVGSWSGSVLSIGANTTGIPGVFSLGSIPSSATIVLF